MKRLARLGMFAAAGCQPAPFSLPETAEGVFAALIDQTTLEVMWQQGSADGTIDFPAARIGNENPGLLILTGAGVRSLHPAVDLSQASFIRIIEDDLGTCAAEGRIVDGWRRIHTRLPEDAVFTSVEQQTQLPLPAVQLEIPIADSVCGGPFIAGEFQPGLPNRTVFDGEPRDHMNLPTGDVTDTYYSIRNGVRLDHDHLVMSTGVRLYVLQRGKPFEPSDQVGGLEGSNTTAMQLAGDRVVLAREDGSGGEVKSWLTLLDPRTQQLTIPDIPGSRDTRTYRAIATSDRGVGAVGDFGLIRTATSVEGPFREVSVTSSRLESVTALEGAPFDFAAVGTRGTLVLFDGLGNSRIVELPEVFDVRTVTQVKEGPDWQIVVAGATRSTPTIFRVNGSDESFEQLEPSVTPTFEQCTEPDECGHARLNSVVQVAAFDPRASTLALVSDLCRPLLLYANGCTRVVRTADPTRDEGLEFDDVFTDEYGYFFGGQRALMLEVDALR